MSKTSNVAIISWYLLIPTIMVVGLGVWAQRAHGEGELLLHFGECICAASVLVSTVTVFAKLFLATLR